MIVVIDNNVFMVKTWTGEVKPVKKVVLFPEKDKKGEVFYKIEGQINLDYFMINYYYDREKAQLEYNRLFSELFEFQEKRLVEE